MPTFRHLLFLSGLFLAVTTVACSSSSPTDDDDDAVESSASDLTVSQRMPRYTKMRSIAAGRGISNGYLLAGIAMDETGLAQCWSEATWACKGPGSPDCGGGPVIAGSADGFCSEQKGGLGMFQFDSGRYSDTLHVYGNDVLTIDGQVNHAINYVVRMVQDSAYTTNAETPEKARAWINRFDPNNGTIRDQWIRTVIRYYNGCPPGADCWSDRYHTYSEGLAQVLADTGAGFWKVGTECPGGGGMVVGAIEDRYKSLGGCGSAKLGKPKTNELTAPDQVGRYSVFEHGSIYWTPSTGAHEVLGRIRDAWKETGWETGPLGYPTSGELDVPGGKKNEFQHGTITWTAATNATAVVVSSP